MTFALKLVFVLLLELCAFVEYDLGKFRRVQIMSQQGLLLHKFYFNWGERFMPFQRYSGAASYTGSRSYESFIEIAEAELVSSTCLLIYNT